MHVRHGWFDHRRFVIAETLSFKRQCLTIARKSSERGLVMHTDRG